MIPPEPGALLGAAGNQGPERARKNRRTLGAVHGFRAKTRSRAAAAVRVFRREDKLKSTVTSLVPALKPPFAPPIRASFTVPERVLVVFGERPRSARPVAPTRAIRPLLVRAARSCSGHPRRPGRLPLAWKPPPATPRKDGQGPLAPSAAVPQGRTGDKEAGRLTVQEHQLRHPFGKPVLGRLEHRTRNVPGTR